MGLQNWVIEFSSEGLAVNTHLFAYENHVDGMQKTETLDLDKLVLQTGETGLLLLLI